MQKLIIFIQLLFISFGVLAQPGTEVFLFEIKQGKSSLELRKPINVSDNKGYDNQPSFTDDGHLLYTSFRDGNTDLVKYDVKSGTKTYLTETSSGEYSPIQMPDKSSLSTITLENSGRQLLWKYDLDGSLQGEELIPYLKIGYHTWLNADTLFAFVLGAHSTLQLIDLSTQRAEVITDDIGRSLHIIPGSSALSYVKKSEGDWKIMKYDISADSSLVITTTQPGVEDMCWYDEKTIIMGKGDLLYSWTETGGWQQIANLSLWKLSGITRLAVSPDRKYLVAVVNEY
ncbi:TolB family protein [Marinoscillum pacificum]|uniref:TolB family protein n=1 Tax=Marinoscillum pacificum TaxID=392723 RepID=UPI002157E2D2|nr:hypothetical protein [Marinoscillum pacificum]